MTFRKTSLWTLLALSTTLNTIHAMDLKKAEGLPSARTRSATTLTRSNVIEISEIRHQFPCMRFSQDLIHNLDNVVKIHTWLDTQVEGPEASTNEFHGMVTMNLLPDQGYGILTDSDQVQIISPQSINYAIDAYTKSFLEKSTLQFVEAPKKKLDTVLGKLGLKPHGNSGDKYETGIIYLEDTTGIGYFLNFYIYQQTNRGRNAYVLDGPNKIAVSAKDFVRNFGKAYKDSLYVWTSSTQNRHVNLARETKNKSEGEDECAPFFALAIEGDVFVATVCEEKEPNILTTSDDITIATAVSESDLYLKRKLDLHEEGEDLPPAKRLRGNDIESIDTNDGGNINTKRNMVETFIQLKTAAEQGDAQAQHDLADCYLKGHGTEEDQNEAFKWYKTAAEGGHLQAHYALVGCYINGYGTNKNVREIHKWLKAGAEKGSALCQYTLGSYYEKTRSTYKNLDKALIWYKIARDNGVLDASNAIARVEKKILEEKKNLGLQTRQTVVSAPQIIIPAPQTTMSNLVISHSSPRQILLRPAGDLRGQSPQPQGYVPPHLQGHVAPQPQGYAAPHHQGYMLPQPQGYVPPHLQGTYPSSMQTENSKLKNQLQLLQQQMNVLNQRYEFLSQEVLQLKQKANPFFGSNGF